MIEHGQMVLGAIVLSATSGLPGLAITRQSNWGGRIGNIMLVLGCMFGLLGVREIFWGTKEFEIIRWPTPIPNADFILAADAISTCFLMPILLVTMLGSVYGLEYWKQSDHPHDGRKLRVFYGLLTASLLVLVLARNSVTFLFGWEGMAVSAFFLVGTQDEEVEVCEAAWLYLAASHAATLSLFTMFALLYGATGNFDLVPISSDVLGPVFSSLIFILALVGFGLKAGLMPLHFWLPSAHAMAPSHVSAVMSGVLIKAGIYGMVRMTWILPDPPIWWGELLLALGAVSAVLGVGYALGQHDIKRLLAYHSIENIGIIVIGLGLAMVGRTMDEPIWVVLGLSGCLLHVWNHALFKSLLFLSAGSVIHARHTREMDHLGGIAKSMPWTAGFFLLGATAICGLPPLNGFISEFLIYLGLFNTLGMKGSQEFAAAAFLVPIMAMMGALALACFVKVFGVVFLGTSRQELPHSIQESGWTMCIPMLVLSACCITIGLAPSLVSPMLDATLAVWTQRGTQADFALEKVAPFGELRIAAFLLLAALFFCTLMMQRRIAKNGLGWTETWGCGYTAPTARMQYTASSIAQFLVELLAWPLQLKIHRSTLNGFFPNSVGFKSHVPEVVLERAVMPIVLSLGSLLFWLRIVQRGSVQAYLLYIFSMLVFLLLFWQ